MNRYSAASSKGITCTDSVHDGCSPRPIVSYRSRMWASGSAAAMAAASSLVRNSLPWSVLKWYFTQNRSPPALIHM